MDSNAVQFRCRLGEMCGVLDHSWEHTVGSGHAALALRSDWQAQLCRCRAELGFRHVRFHAILSDSMGTLVEEEDRLIYSFRNADLVIDFLISIGMKPFVELSFMPLALASGRKTVFHYKANVTPPRKLEQWATLIRKLAIHWIERYGLREVRSWLFEVWNEPNLKAFWPSTQRHYFELYGATAKALKGVDDQFQVGGPATANNKWIADFVRYTAENHLPADFVSTHHYPTDALGSDDEDTESQLAATPRGILRRWAQDAQRHTAGKPFYYTEWNISSNPRDHLHDEPFAAPAIVKSMMEANGLTAGYSFWTFSDIFSENYFPSVPFHGGFGLLSLHNIAKPAYRAFEILHRVGRRLALVDGMHPTVDCWVIEGDSEVVVLLTNHAMPRHHIADEEVEIELRDISRPRAARIERIDQRHANPKAAWIAMNSPEYPATGQIERLDRASRLAPRSIGWRVSGNAVRLNVNLPAHAVAAITLGSDRRT